jgi:NAD(P)-dependent dehydrogenase (short-subunit alcohol dehydrogenase family)
MSLPLEGLSAIVTGAGRGLGRAEALELARLGASVVVNDYGRPGRDGSGEASATPAEEVAEEIRTTGGSATAHHGDVSDFAQARGLVELAVSTYGKLDILVNNAGILRDRTIAKMSEDDWDAVIRVHLRGHFLPTRAAVRYWREAKRPGHVVSTASTSGLLGNFGQTNYGAAKAGIAAFSTIVAIEGARSGITSNAIAPSALTRMTLDLMPQELKDERERRIDAGEFDFFAPENVAPLVAFLCSDAAAHISGKVFGVQGDAVELYQPFTSVAVIQNHDTRFTAEGIAARAHELFEASGISPEVENMMAKLRFTMTERSAL